MHHHHHHWSKHRLGNGRGFQLVFFMTTCFKLNFCECPPKNHQQLVAVTKVSSHHLSAVTHNQQNQILEHPVFIGGCADFSRFVFFQMWMFLLVAIKKLNQILDICIGCNQDQGQDQILVVLMMAQSPSPMLTVSPTHPLRSSTMHQTQRFLEERYIMHNCDTFFVEMIQILFLYKTIIN